MPLHDEIHRPIMRQLIKREERHHILAAPAHLLRRTCRNLLTRGERIHRMIRIVGHRRGIVSVTDQQIVRLHRPREQCRRLFSAEMSVALCIVRHYAHERKAESRTDHRASAQHARIMRKKACRQDRCRQKRRETVRRILRRHKLEENRYRDRPDEQELRTHINHRPDTPRTKERKRQRKAPREHPEGINAEVEIPNIPFLML